MTRRKKSLPGSILELTVIVAIALGLALAIQAFLIKPYSIPSASMEPTLGINQRVLVNRIGESFSSPHVGDIVVFHPPKNYSQCADPNEGEIRAGQSDGKACDAPQRAPSSQTFIKRVVGVAGDRLSIRNGHVIRNGMAEKDGYTVPCDGAASCEFPGTITIPRGDYYMMGDNRPDSEDSRFWGPVPRGWIIGQAFFTYWPPSRIGFL